MKVVTVFQKKKFFTLLELLIALSLMAFLLTTVLYFYKQITFSNTIWDRKEQELFSARYVEERLFYIISRASTEKKDHKKTIAFHTLENVGTSQALLLCFDNGITRNKLLSNETLGLIFLDNSNLTIGYWPEPSRWKSDIAPAMSHKEVLLENVSQLKFSFFSALDKEETSSTIKEVPPAHSANWSLDWKKLPHIVYIDIFTNTNKEIHISIPIAKASPSIIYKE